MNLEITDKKENLFLERTEIKGKLRFEGLVTPSNETVRSALANELKADKDLVIIKKIGTKYSYQEADFLAYAYHNALIKKKVETTTNHMKKKTEEEKKKLAEEKKEE